MSYSFTVRITKSLSNYERFCDVQRYVVGNQGGMALVVKLDLIILTPEDLAVRWYCCFIRQETRLNCVEDILDVLDKFFSWYLVLL